MRILGEVARDASSFTNPVYIVTRVSLVLARFRRVLGWLSSCLLARGVVIVVRFPRETWLLIVCVLAKNVARSAKTVAFLRGYFARKVATLHVFS